MHAGRLVLLSAASPLILRYAGRWFKHAWQPSRSGVQQRRVQRSAEACIKVAGSRQGSMTVGASLLMALPISGVSGAEGVSSVELTSVERDD